MTAKRAKSKSSRVSAANLVAAIGGCVSLLSSPRIDIVFPRILRMAERIFPADAYALWQRDGDDWRIALSEGLSERYLDSSPIAAYAARVPLKTIIAEDVSALKLVSNRQNFYKAEGIKSFAAMPILVRQELRGTITFYFRKRRQFSTQDEALLSLITDLSAVAIGNAELYEAQTRLTAEAAEARARYKFLSDISAILASSLDHAFILGELARSLVPQIADWCAIDLLAADGSLDRLAVAHRDPEKMRIAREMQRKYPVDLKAPRGLGAVLRTGEAQINPVITPAMIENSPMPPELIAVLRTLEPCSSVQVAMIARGRVLGAITLAQAESRRHFSQHDIPFVQDIANRAALYLDSSRSTSQPRPASSL